MGFQLPQPGFGLMQLPQQARQQFQQMPGVTPQMVQSQNLMAAQQNQQQQQQQQGQDNPLAGAMKTLQQGQDTGKQINGLINPQPNQMASNPLSGSMQNPAANNEAAMQSYSQLAAGDQAAAAQKMLSSGLPQNQSWLQRNLGLGGGGGGLWSSIFGG